MTKHALFLGASLEEQDDIHRATPVCQGRQRQIVKPDQWPGAYKHPPPFYLAIFVLSGLELWTSRSIRSVIYVNEVRYQLSDGEIVHTGEVELDVLPSFDRSGAEPYQNPGPSIA